MNAIAMLNRYFIGQESIKPEVSHIMEEMAAGRNLNLLIRGPSGYGKTLLARIISNYVGLNNTLQYDDEDVIDLFRSNYRIHILDEAHKIKEPEPLYSLMESEKFIFIILTNEYDMLKEPFENRCIAIQLLDYTLKDMQKIVSRFFKSKQLGIPESFCSNIALYCRGNPREAILLSKRLEIIFRQKGVPIELIELEELLKTLRIYKGGFTDLDIKYLDFLKENQTASLNTLCRVLNVPKNTILNNIEPFLIKKGLIKITSRGRTYDSKNN